MFFYFLLIAFYESENQKNRIDFLKFPTKNKNKTWGPKLHENAVISSAETFIMRKQILI